MSSARRTLLFDTPARPFKRARRSSKAKPKATAMTIPRSLLPETKQFTKSALTSSLTSNAYSTIGADITQGDSSAQIIGSKFRIKRLRVMYNFNSVTQPSRIVVYISKRPSQSPSVVNNMTTALDTNLYTVLYERLIPDDSAYQVGTFDVPMNLQVELDVNGAVVYKNDIRICVYSLSNGTNVQSNCGYSIWYTDN